MNPEGRDSEHSESEESSEGRIFSPTRRGYIAPDISLRLTPWLHAREHPETFSTPQVSQQILTRDQLEAWAAFTHSRGRIHFSVRDSSGSLSRMADDSGENPTRGDTDDNRGNPTPFRENSPPTSSHTPQEMAKLENYLEHLTKIQEATLKQQQSMERLRIRELEIKEQKLYQYMKAQEQALQEAKQKHEAETSLAGIDRKCLPVLHEGEDVLCFLENFQICLIELQIDKRLWLSLLRTQVYGPLAKLLSECKGKDWEAFKKLVLQRFAYNPESLRVKLREIKWNQKESICCLMAEIKTLIRQWLDVSEAKSREEIIDLLAREQLGLCLPEQLRIDVLGRSPKNALEYSLTADELLSYKKYFFSKS